MTCIVGVEAEGGVWFAADSYVGGDTYSDTIDTPKVITVGPFRVAVSGPTVCEMVLRQLRVPTQRRGEDDAAFVARVALQARALFAQADIGPDAPYGYLFAYRGRVYDVGQGFGVTRSSHGYAASGAGYTYAIGALAVLSPSLDPRKRAIAAVKAACRHCPHVRPPITTEWVPA